MSLLKSLEKAIRMASVLPSSIHATALYLEDHSDAHPKDVAEALKNVLRSSCDNHQNLWVAWCVFDAFIKLPSTKQRSKINSLLTAMLPVLVAETFPWSSPTIHSFLDLPRSWWAQCVLEPANMTAVQSTVARELEKIKSKTQLEAARPSVDIGSAIKVLDDRSSARAQMKIGEKVGTYVAIMYDMLKREVCNHCCGTFRDRACRDVHGRVHFYYQEPGRTAGRLMNCSAEQWLAHTPSNTGEYVSTLTLSKDQYFVDVNVRKRQRDKMESAAATEDFLTVGDPSRVETCSRCNEKIVAELRQGDWGYSDVVMRDGKFTHKACL
eukprot:PhF_6_TR7316/c0_g1_i1/m.10966